MYSIPVKIKNSFLKCIKYFEVTFYCLYINKKVTRKQKYLVKFQVATLCLHCEEKVNLAAERWDEWPRIRRRADSPDLCYSWEVNDAYDHTAMCCVYEVAGVIVIFVTLNCLWYSNRQILFFFWLKILFVKRMCLF